MTGPVRTLVAEVDGSSFWSHAVPVIGWDEPDDSAWLAARRLGIGASEIGSVVGVPGAFSSPYALYWSKVLGWETEQTFAMKVGHKLEPIIGELFAEEFPGVTVVRPKHRLYRHPDYPWMLASPDFLAVEQCGVCMGRGWLVGRFGGVDPAAPALGRNVECSNCDGAGGWIEPVEAKSDEGKDWKGEPPPKHLMQLWQQLLVFGAARGHLVRLRAKKLQAYLVDPDSSGTDAILTYGSWFAGLLAAATPPPVDGTEATDKALQRLFPPGDYADEDPAAAAVLPVDLVGEFMAAHEARARAEARFAEARARVRVALRDARWGVDTAGNKLIEHRKYKKGDYYVKTHEVDEIRKAW